MKPYTAQLMLARGYQIGDWIPCDYCGATAVDVSHEPPVGMGRNKSKVKVDVEHMKFVCRRCHEKHEGKGR